MPYILVIQTLLPGVVAGLFTLFGKTAFWPCLPGWARQAAYGVAFGLVAVFATETGVHVVDGGVLNVRDAAPLVAGLAFGGPAGVVAGVIGGVERWLCVLWGGGETTRLACSLAAVLAGALAALLRRFVFGNRAPAMGYALAIGAATGVLHMLLILLTNLGDLEVAFRYVQACAAPMIALTGLATGVALIGRGYINHERLVVRPPYLINDLGFRLLAIVLAAFVAVTWFTVGISNRVSTSEAESLLRVSLEDLSAEVEAWGWEDLTGDSPTWRIQQTGAAIVYETDGGAVLSARGAGESVRGAGVIADAPGEFVDDVLYRLTVFGDESYAMNRSFGAYSVLVYVPEEEADYFSDVVLYLIVLMEVLVHATLFLVLFQLVRKRVADNLRRVGEGLDAIAAGDLDTRVDVRTHQEFCALSDDVNATVGVLKGYIDEAEHRHDAELELGRQIQRSALPSVFPPFPERRDFDLYASMDAAREVGGDFYDFLLLDGRFLVFLIADVSGKGVPAALFMMKAKAELHALLESGIDVDEAMARANGRLCRDNEPGMFVTVWLGKLELATGALAFVNAGHNPPLLRRAGGAYEYLRAGKPDFFLAGMETTRYRRNAVELAPGDRLFLYTDGVTEACDPNEALFGEGRLRDALNAPGAGERGPRETCEAVGESVRAFARGAEQSDDITMLAVEVRVLCGHDRIVTRADLGSIELVRAFFEERLSLAGVGPRVANRVQVAVDEVYSNICRYSGATRATCSIARVGADLVVEFTDDGAAFDPTQAPEPDVTLPPEERAIGGLGIHMVRKMARAMTYERLEPGEDEARAGEGAECAAEGDGATEGEVRAAEGDGATEGRGTNVLTLTFEA